MHRLQNFFGQNFATHTHSALVITAWPICMDMYTHVYLWVYAVVEVAASCNQKTEGCGRSHCQLDYSPRMVHQRFSLGQSEAAWELCNTRCSRTNTGICLLWTNSSAVEGVINVWFNKLYVRFFFDSCINSECIFSRPSSSSFLTFFFFASFFLTKRGRTHKERKGEIVSKK